MLLAGLMWGEENKIRPQGPKTARTSEGYGEATFSTAEKLFGVLANLTRLVPALAGWDEVWNLTADSSFLDVGSGYGKVRSSRGAESEVAAATFSFLAHPSHHHMRLLAELRWCSMPK